MRADETFFEWVFRFLEARDPGTHKLPVRPIPAQHSPAKTA